MATIDDIRRRFRISNLQARDELLEIERIALLREFVSPQTSQNRREEVMHRRVHLSAQRDRILDELNRLKAAS